jgi:acetyl esterase/lipase
MLLARLYLQLGVFLDYYTGQHVPSISETLRAALDSKEEDHERHVRELVPSIHHLLFPQLGVTSSWPPTFLIHGSLDSVVPVHESHHMRDLLLRSGVPVRLDVVDGQDHTFDYESDAESLHAAMFDDVQRFLEKHIGGIATSGTVAL